MKQRKRTTKIQDTQIVKIESEKGAITKALNIAQAVQDFLDAQDIRAISKEVYRQGLNRFLTWQESNQITQPTRNDLLRFKDFLKESGLAVNTCNSYLIATKRFFGYLHSEFGYPDITKGIKGFMQPRGHLREALTDSQVSEMQNKIDISTIQGKRNLALITLMADTGLRTCSIVKLDLRDLKQIGEKAKLFYKGKGRDEKDQFSFLQEDTLKMIMFYLKARGKVRSEDPLFCSHSDRNKGQRLTTRTIRGLIKDLLREINFDDPRLSAHSFRHFFATNSLSNGAEIFAVSKAMGHASIETTQIYLHELDRMGKGAAERFVKYERREIDF